MVVKIYKVFILLTLVFLNIEHLLFGEKPYISPRGKRKERMMEKIKGKKVCIELKNGSKYFGVLKNIDNSPKIFKWVILDIENKETFFADSEIVRVEVLE